MPNTTNPIFKIQVSSIGFTAQHERPQTQNRRDPDTNELALLLMSRKPQVNRQQKRNRSRRQETDLGELNSAHRFLQVKVG